MHWFSTRSNADVYHEQLIAAAHRSDVFVFGGDIFDFKWSRFANDQEAANHAVNWLADFIEQCPDTEFRFLLGNHDCTDIFVQAMQPLTANKNLSVDEYYLRIGDTVFLHGDIIDTDGTQDSIENCRKKWSPGSPRGKLANLIYDLAVACRIHRIAARYLKSHKQIGDKLISYLDELNEGRGLKTVVYGHTHWRADFTIDGVRFLNCGAAIKGLPFAPIEIQIDS